MSEQKEILIVEDSEESVIFLSEILEAHGYQYRVATNGKEAMAAMRDSRPDLVLLDIMMPRKTGLGVLKDMKKDPNLAKTPVIIVTGASETTGVDLQTGEAKPMESYEDDFARAYGVKLHDIMDGLAPADGFIEKPIEPQSLIGEIEKLLP